MISKLTGTLVALSEEAAFLTIPAGFELQVFVPEFVRRQLQPKIGEDVTLRTNFTLDGNPQQGKLVPKLIGFMNEAEQEFFDLICSVDGVGMKKALRAMVRPVREVAVAIEEQDDKALSALPGIGPAVADRIIAKLRRKMAKFALMIEKEFPGDSATELSVLDEAYEALLVLGHTPADAREKIERATEGKKKVKSVESLLQEIYSQSRGG